jgi:hypothetical protein
VSPNISPQPKSSNTPDRRARVRVTRFEDYEKIAMLEARYGLSVLADNSYGKWVHLWQGNPAYRELQFNWNIGWLIEAENGEIVGSMGNIPLLYEFEGRRILAVSGRAWVVEPAYRSAGLLLLDHVINQRGVDLFVNNTVGATSLDAVNFFKCERVPVGLWDEMAAWITDYPSFFASALVMKNYPLVKPLSYPLAGAFFLKDQFKRSAVREGDVEISCCLHFDDRFDRFWMELKAKNPQLLLAVRTREVLEWHFKYALSDNRLWIATIAEGSRLVAYAIFDRKDILRLGLKRMRLLDFQSLLPGADMLFPILAWALKKCVAEKLHLLANVGRYLDEPGIMETASFREKLPAWTFFYRASDPGLAASLKDVRAWAPSLFDGDASL